MITKEQIIKLGGVPIKEGKKYSDVLLSPLENTFSLKSPSGNEYIYHDEKIFHHSDGKNCFVAFMIQDVELLKKLLVK